MTQEHPITPPSELFKQWEDDILNQRDNVDHVLDCAWRNGFQAGADQELQACCEWLVVDDWKHVSKNLRAARRPKPPSLKEQAQRILVENGTTLDGRMELDPSDIALIRRALESLPD